MDVGSLATLLGVVVGVATVTAVATIFAVPMRNSWLRRLSQQAAIQGAGFEEELNRMKERMAELEERLDFAERKLAERKSDHDLLNRG